MRKFWVLPIFGFFLGIAIRLSLASPEDFTPVFSQASDIAVLHKNMEEWVASQAGKAMQLSKKVDHLPPEFVKNGAREIIQSGAVLVRDLKHLNSQMARLRSMLAVRNLTSLDVKFTLWGTAFDAAMSDAKDLEELSGSLRDLPDSQKLGKALQESAEIFDSLHADLKELHVRFQVIANILRIFRDFKSPVVENRVLGETWEEHVKRTGHAGIADPSKPTKKFNAHSKFAIEDRNPKHVVWACEASIADYLKSRVKGTEHAYTNTTKEPFCLRCHEQRSGKHNMRWCTPSNSKEIIDVCNRLERTAPP